MLFGAKNVPFAKNSDLVTQKSSYRAVFHFQYINNIRRRSETRSLYRNPIKHCGRNVDQPSTLDREWGWVHTCKSLHCFLLTVLSKIGVLKNLLLKISFSQNGVSGFLFLKRLLMTDASNYPIHWIHHN